MSEWWDGIVNRFIQNFISDDRWKYLLDGLGVTLKVTFFALLMGLVLGFLVAVVRSTHDKTGRFKFLNTLCRLYLTVIRGTPVVIQLLIIYFVIFGSVDIDKSLVAIIAFGINSGAYVAEIFRSGIMSIDVGQFEAGRSLGFDYKQTMWHIIMPQAFKNVIPPLANEFIVLLKETAICGFIGLQDLTRGGSIIQGRTFDAFMPLVAVALIYLVFVMLLSRLVTLLERRLRRNER
jgi:His/Glu/Gln/Arg/opine family amino acid ABC transporter permease subunit